MPVPSSRAAGRISSSMPREISEYSICRSLIGCTAWARRLVARLSYRMGRGLVQMHRLFPPSLQVRLYRGRVIHLRVRVARFVFLARGQLIALLPLLNKRFGLMERLLERIAFRQSLLEIGAAEIREVVFVGAAE